MASSELRPLEEKLAASWPPDQWQDVTLLVAVSGGADSVALLRGIRALKQGGAGQLWVGHFNHHLRPTADADEQFVQDLCQALRVPLKLGAAAGQQSSSGDGLEAAARQARYEFLQASAEELGARFVVTAHTADDQVETILHRIARGTGLEGLQGIPRTRPLGPAVCLMRPLLGVRHCDLESYLRTLDQPWCEDETNRELRFARNRIRHEVLPLLEKISPGACDAIVRLGQVAAEAQEVIDCEFASLWPRAVSLQAESSVSIDCTAIFDKPRHLVRELLVRVWRMQRWPQQAMGFAEWNYLAEMIVRGGADRMLPGGIVARRERSSLILEPGGKM